MEHRMYEGYSINRVNFAIKQLAFHLEKKPHSFKYIFPIEKWTFVFLQPQLSVQFLKLIFFLG